MRRKRDVAAASALSGEVFAWTDRTGLECAFAMWAAAHLMVLCGDPEAAAQDTEWGETAEAMMAQKAKAREE